jgi:hypothetical protein
MLGLSFMPCGDILECNNTEMIASIDVGHEKHSHDKEGCTPFCVCSCCTSTVFFTPLLHYKIGRLFFKSSIYPLYKIPYFSSISFSIWQPPKLS